MIEWLNFAVDVKFSDPTADELGILRTKIEDKNLVLHRAKLHAMYEII